MNRPNGPLALTTDNLPITFEEFEPLVSVYLWKDPEDPSGNVRARATVCIEHNELFTDKMLCSLEDLDETVAKTLIIHAVKVRFWEALGIGVTEPDIYELPESDDGVRTWRCCKPDIHEIPEADDGTD